MKKLIAVVLTVTVFAGLAPAAAVEGFLTSWPAAQKAAQAQKKPIFVHFTTTWCVWCRKIENDIYKKDEGKEAMKGFVPVSLDCTRRGRSGAALQTALANGTLMSRYGGRGYPFLVITAQDGALLSSFSGYKPMGPFKAELAKAAAALKKYNDFEASVAAADKNNYDQSLKVMKAYSEYRVWDKALVWAQRVVALDPQDKKGGHAAVGATMASAVSAGQSEAAINTTLAAVRKLDPQNAKGILEKALLAQAEFHFRLAQTPDEVVRKKNLEANLKILTELTGPGKKLKNAQMALYLLARAHAVLDDNAKALAALEKAVQADPKSKMASGLKKLIEKLKSGKSGKSGQ